MDAFEYVIVLTSLILGLGVSQVLVGVANLITNREIKWSLPHAMMTFVIFITQIQEWWITYTYSMAVTSWTLPLVMILMVYPILLFVAARVLFPYEEIEDKAVDLGAYYWKKWPALFTILLLAALTSILQNYLFQGFAIWEQPTQIAFSLTLGFFLWRRIQNRSMHIVLLSLFILGWVVYLIQEDFAIGS